ncbi:MAG: hypothetical protein E6Q83_19780 [Thiothrix sp.]|nr:MAG: hypothetical protein E6Q83_19780 [Thiothrix sp.]
MKRIITGALIFLLTSTSNATMYRLSDKVEEFGKWQILKTVDPMTDKASCMGIYDKNLDIQIDKYSFLISMNKKGGVKYITNRIDEGDVKINEATQTERLNDYAVFEDEAFYPLLESKRFRVKIDTVLKKEVMFDFDMDGFKKAVDYLRQPECN